MLEVSWGRCAEVEEPRFAPRSGEDFPRDLRDRCGSVLEPSRQHGNGLVKFFERRCARDNVGGRGAQ